jgi:ATP synthase protein I
MSRQAWPDTEAGVEEDSFKSLTSQEAQVLRARLVRISPWRVVGVQAGCGVVLTLAAWLVFRRDAVVWSVLYGAAAVVLPAALLARGMGRLPVGNPSAAVLGFAVWEFAKIAVAVGMLAAAPRVVPDLQWPALLVSVIVCLKMNWLALWWGRSATTE